MSCVLAVGFIDNTECEEVTRLRIEQLTKTEQQEKLCNLIGWCLRSGRYDDDTEMIVQHFTLLYSLDRIDEFIQRVSLSFEFDFWLIFLKLCTFNGKKLKF